MEIGRFSPGHAGEHYLILGELVSHKRVEVAVGRSTRLGLPLSWPATARSCGA